MEPARANHSSARMMVPTNKQPSPLQRQMHPKSVQAGASTPFKNYSRIQQEVERGGLEVQKENLLCLSLSRSEKSSELKADGAPSLDRLVEHVSVPYTDTKPGFSKAPGFHDKEASHGQSVYPTAYTCHALASMGTSTTSLSFHPTHLTLEHAQVGGLFFHGGDPVEDQIDHVKRLKNMQEKLCLPLSDAKKDEHHGPGAPLCCAADAIVTGHMCSSKKKGTQLVNKVHTSSKEYAKRGNHAASMASMEVTTNAIGLKLFTSSANVQMPTALLTYSNGEPSLPLSLEITQKLASSQIQKTPVQEISQTDADWGKFLALSATPQAAATAAEVAIAGILPFQQRFKQLQAYLKQCDETDPNMCIQALRSLSAAARSDHAVELETRAIKLSLEEGKEMKRMRLLNVFGKISERTIDDAGTTPQGPRLPAPGGTSK